MGKSILKYILVFSLAFFVGCAKRGSITGGAKDTIAPVLKMSFPKNFSTEFKGNTIKLTFDEFIKLKDLRKQLIISPPMKNEPLILPTTASKILNIKINDTLQENTTYSFNFGQSITDNNEGNPLNQFKYVFSTGKQIDSLWLSGKVKDAYSKEVESFVSIMLYEVNSTFNDSVVYKQMPRYVTNTLDSLRSFKLENLKAGNYLLVALKDYNSNNKYEPQKDKIGFYKKHIRIPNDTLFELELFKEQLPFKAFKPSLASGNRLLMGYEGNMKLKSNRPQIVLKNQSDIIPSIITKLAKKDSLQIWHKPIKADSLTVNINLDSYKKDFTIRIKDAKKDTLAIKNVQQGILNFRERLTLESATPINAIEKSKIKLKNKEGAPVLFETEYDDFQQLIYVDFKREEDTNYSLTLEKGALTDFFEKTNDSLTFKYTTRTLADYGNLVINLQKASHYPLLVELTNDKGETIASTICNSEKENTIEFNLLEPAKYSLRAIYDDNKNGIYDPGVFLQKKYAEEVIYLSKEIDLRANWDVVQSFDLSIPYSPEVKKKSKKKPENKSNNKGIRN